MNTTKKPKRKRKSNLFPKTLGQTIGKITKPIMKKHGLPDGLIEQWPRIAGNQLASCCTPVACKRRKKDKAATLILSVAPSHALVAQHASGIIMEKINLHYGYQVVDHIQLKPATSTSAQPMSSLSNEQLAMASKFTQLANDLKKQV